MALSGVLVLGACSSQRPTETPTEPTVAGTVTETLTPEPTTITQTVTPEATTAPATTPDVIATDERDCGMRRVYPGERYNTDNAADIDRQMGALNALYNEGPIGFRDSLTTARMIGQMMRSSQRDPMYASALFQATEDLTAGKSVNADTFLGYDVEHPEMCSTYYATSEDQERATEDFVKGMNEVMRQTGRKVAERGSENLERAYERLQREYAELCHRHDIPGCNAR